MKVRLSTCVNCGRRVRRDDSLRWVHVVRTDCIKPFGRAS